MDFVDVVEVASAVLRQLKAEPYRESYFVRRAIIKVEAIIRDLGQIKNFHTDEEFNVWLTDLLALVYKMEDFAEMFTLSRWQHLRRMDFGRMCIFILSQMMHLKATVCFGSKSLMPLYNIHDDIKRLMNRKESGEGRGYCDNSSEVSKVFGLEKDREEVVTWLIDTNSIPNLGFILISGQTGSGKTTLATEIYKSPEIKSHFKSRAWVSADEDTLSNLRSILQKITNDSTVDMASNLTELEEKICDILHKDRWLVVVDNVQSPFLFKKRSDIIKSGTHIEPADKGNGSRVIMTMRSKYDLKSTKNKDKLHVEESFTDQQLDLIDFRHQRDEESSYSASKSLIRRFMDEYTNFICELQPLQDDDAWNLLLEKAPDVKSLDSDNLKRKILEICQGMPSAIVVLGRFLRTKESYKEWLKDLEHPTDRNGVSVSKILALMNSDLTFGLRPCLFYFLLFTREREIPVRRLLLLWVAERLIVTENPNPEETAERILIYFAIKGIIEIVQLRKDGDPKTCRMPGIVYDICLSKAEDIFGLLHIPTTSGHGSKSQQFGVRRVAEHDIKNYSPDQYSDFKHLRSYLSFNTRNEDTPVVEIGNFFNQVIGHRGFGLLRVLDLERVYKPKLPENLGKLYQLRYLGLRWTFLDTLPHSVGELSYLETLDVKHTYISSPPHSIWKMKYLRHLWLNEIRLDVKKHSICLSNLQTLWGLFVDNKTPVKNGLDILTNLKKLGLTFNLESLKELNEWIARLQGLQSLRLRSKDKNGRPSNLETLNSISGLENLTNLYLLGKLWKLPNQSYFPKSLAVLTLSVSMLKEDPMPTLAMLPNLSVLGLLADSYIGEKMWCPRGGFPKLRILRLWMLKKLVTWTMNKDAMQSLCELEIRCCHKLKELPDSLNRSKIDKIILTNMQTEFVANVQAKIPKEKLETPPLQVLCDCQGPKKQEISGYVKSLEDNLSQGAATRSNSL